MARNSESVPHSHVPYAEAGSGHYSDSILGCFCVISEATPLCMKSIDSIPCDSADGAFVVCDYGTADGGTSMSLIRNIIDKVQTRSGKKQQIHVIYEDQAVNDFQSLLYRIHGFIPDPPSYLLDHENVFVTFCGTSFFTQCLPDNSVHLAFSATAMHWLSKRPSQISGGKLHHLLITDDEESRQFAEQASRDWQTILLHRANELKPGGQMLLDGLITQDEFNNASFNNYYRTVEECCAPFTDSTSAVTNAGLRLVSIETKVVECPYHLRWLREGKPGDVVGARKIAHDYIVSLRPWSNYTFFSALAESRPKSERDRLVDEYYERYENEIAECPEDHAKDYVHAYIHIAKNK